MLVGREAERARIEELLASGRGGASGVLVIRGEAGIGKSALLEHAASAAGGALVLRARGIDSELELAWAGLHELLRPVLDTVERLAGPQAAALRAALGLADDAAAERHLVGAATLGVLGAIAEERPVVVLVDDAQWLDGPSAAALLFAARRLLADAVVVIVAVRSGVASAFDDAGLDELALEGLAPGAARELLAARAGRAIAADTADWLHAATGGNPLALTELASEAPRLRPGPVDDHIAVGTRIANALGRRLDTIGPEAGRAVLAAAVADGRRARARSSAPPRRSAARSRGSSARRPPACSSSTRAAPPSGTRSCARPCSRAPAPPSAGPRTAPTRPRCATAGADGDRAVWHEAAGALAPDEAIAAALAAAGERAAGRGGHAAAASAFEQAARLTPEAGTPRAAPAARRRGRLAGRRRPARARAALRDPARPRGRAPARPRAGAARARSRRRSRCCATRPRAADDPARAAEMLAEAAYAAVYTGAGDLDELARGALELAEGPRARALALIAHGAALVIRGDAAAAEALEEAGALIRATPELRDDVSLAVWIGVVPAFLRAGLEQYEPLAAAIALARDRGAVGVLPVALFFLGVGQSSAGSWARAAASFTEAVRLADEAGLRVDATASLAGLSRLEARRGNGSLAADALARAREARLPFFQAWALHAQGESALGAGDAAAALEAFEAKRALLGEHGLVDPDLSPGPELAETLTRLGRADEASAVAGRCLADAEAKGAPWALARAWRAVALASATDEAALAAFDAALALHAHDTFETSRTRLCLGERLRRAGRRSDARTPLRAALAGFDDLGAAPWSARAAAELQATGESVRRRDPTTLDELTPQELRVATMLAGGATTREAGAALYLSPKTVEYHLRHVYLKLGINSRAALADALATDAPPAPG